MTTSTDPETLAKLSLEELQKQLKTSTQGLSTKEASDRLLRDGENKLPEETISPIMQFLSHFWGPIAWMTEAEADSLGIGANKEPMASLTTSSQSISLMD